MWIDGTTKVSRLNKTISNEVKWTSTKDKCISKTTSMVRPSKNKINSTSFFNG